MLPSLNPSVPAVNVFIAASWFSSTAITTRASISFAFSASPGSAAATGIAARKKNIAASRRTGFPHLDLVRDLGAQADAADGEHDLRRQLLVALETASRERVAHRLLDLALRGDADLLQEPEQTAGEDVLVHCGLLLFGA